MCENYSKEWLKQNWLKIPFTILIQLICTNPIGHKLHSSWKVLCSTMRKNLMYAFNFDIISNVIASEWTRRQLWRNLGVVHKVINYAVSKGNGETMKNMFFFQSSKKKIPRKKISLLPENKKHFIYIKSKSEWICQDMNQRISIINILRMTYYLVKWEKGNQNPWKAENFSKRAF